MYPGPHFSEPLMTGNIKLELVDWQRRQLPFRNEESMATNRAITRLVCHHVITYKAPSSTLMNRHGCCSTHSAQSSIVNGRNHHCLQSNYMH
ncbi:hypothetical protein BLOT_007936 [Blomia tropicalis]|nr:hypothetical protein BLOT_007936 [Blomia tropicalis]